jgi:hypothetical protein
LKIEIGSAEELHAPLSDSETTFSEDDDNTQAHCFCRCRWLDSEEGSMRGELERDVLPFSNGVNSKNNKNKCPLCYSVKKYVVKSEPFIFSTANVKPDPNY